MRLEVVGGNYYAGPSQPVGFGFSRNNVLAVGNIDWLAPAGLWDGICGNDINTDFGEKISTCFRGATLCRTRSKPNKFTIDVAQVLLISVHEKHLTSNLIIN